MTTRSGGALAIALMVLLGLTVLTGSGVAKSPEPALHMQAPAPGEVVDEFPAPQFAPTREDTAWFGGDNGSGVAYAGGVWDFETPGSNGYQGCRSFDETANPATYFGRVTALDFLNGGDPCIPMILGTPGMIWCGVHQDEADQRGFLAGMGYQNMMCQRAFSPLYANFNPTNQAIDLSFSYFNHSEGGYDYSYVYVLCYDAAGEVIEEYMVTKFDGAIGDYQAPAFYDEGVEVPAGMLPPATAQVQVELRFDSDGVWSDEDGFWDSPCGPFAADDVVITVGASTGTYNFDNDAQGWTFDRCTGIGAYMHIVHDYEYNEWVDELGLGCECPLDGDAIGFVSTVCTNGPGLVPGQIEQFETGPVPRAGYPGPYYNKVVVEHDQFVNFPHSTGAHYRPGWRMYPFTNEVNPVPRWSQRHGTAVWYFTTNPYCGLDRENLSTMAGEPLPVEWDSVKYTYEIYCSCDAFGTPPTVCVEEGCTGGAPVIDNCRLGLTHSPYAPPITLMDGGLFMDGFGQNYPTFLDPCDRCNANVSYDLSRDDTAKNDWHGDSAVVMGPVVGSQAARFLCEMCFKVARVGPCQHAVPGYQTWRSRLASDPEDDFVCVLMDSLETQNHTQIWKNKFYTYFHENATGYAGSPDYGPQNEILPDKIWVPGTRIEYYYRSYYYNGGAPPSEYYTLGYPPAFEVEFLPGMRNSPGAPYVIEWPSVLYVDAYNRGATETYMSAALEQLGIAFDKFDLTDNTSNFNASFQRSLGGTTYNPGGYGNNGCTMEQLLGYRLIIFSNGSYGIGSCERRDFDLFESWLETTDCAIYTQRRGIVFDGDAICKVMADNVYGLAIQFCHNVLGTRLVADSYAAYNEDLASCVYLAPATGAAFAAEGALRGTCMGVGSNVVGVQPGLPNVTGNLDYWSFEQTGNQEYVDYAQVVRRDQQAGVANWRSAVNGFGFGHLTERGSPGNLCPADSAAVINGILDIYGPMLGWIAQGATPFGLWFGACFSWHDVPDETHLSGPVNYLHQSRPNPFNTRATIRFSLASAGEVDLVIYDVAGRLVKTLLHGEAPAGESSLVWDGTDSDGNRAGAGVFWMQMTTHDGFSSGKKMMLLK
jgi:hypothetical protein